MTCCLFCDQARARAWNSFSENGKPSAERPKPTSLRSPTRPWLRNQARSRREIVLYEFAQAAALLLMFAFVVVAMSVDWAA